MLKKHSFWRLGVIGMSAVSGIEMALWDILGKHLGVPVWRLLGGKVRDKVQACTPISAWATCGRSMKPSMPSPLLARAHEVVAKGYGAFKAVFIPYTHYHAPLPEVDKVGRMMEALRKAVGPEIEVMVDFHGRPASAAAALAYIDALAPGAPDVRRGAPAAGRNRCAEGGGGAGRRCRSPPASGWSTGPNSRNCSPPAQSAIVQPDICHCGGLLEAKKIAAMAEAVSVGVAPAQSAGPDRRRRRPALRRLDAQPRDPGGDGRCRPLVLRGRGRAHPPGGRLLAGARGAGAGHHGERGTPASGIPTSPRSSRQAPPCSTTARSWTGDRHERPTWGKGRDRDVLAQGRAAASAKKRGALHQRRHHRDRWRPLGPVS